MSTRASPREPSTLPAVDERLVMPECGYEIIDGQVVPVGPCEASTLPAVDERLVMPECGYEIIDGQVVPVSPAYWPHARRHAKLAALLEAHVAAGYTVAVDLLTRTGLREDFAPDAAILETAPDSETGGRRLEVIAFEVVSTETLAHAGAKAASLMRRGVRRVIAIDVERERALEWSVATAGWENLGSDARIEDPVFVVPLPARELAVIASADDAMARALVAKRNAVIVAQTDQALAEGRAEGTAAAVIAVLVARGLVSTANEQACILATRDPEILARWLALAATCAAVAELFATDP